MFYIKNIWKIIKDIYEGLRHAKKNRIFVTVANKITFADKESQADDAFFKAMLSVILKAAISNFMGRGRLFLKKDGKLDLAAAVGCNGQCQSINFGDCLYEENGGKRAVFVFHKGKGHGHYSVPLFMGNDIFGALTFCVATKKRSGGTELLLTMIGDFISNILARRITDRTILESQLLATARVAHDIRSPLSTMANLAEIVLDNGQTQENQGLLNMIMQTSERLAKMANDILEFSRLGNIKLKSDPFSLVDAIQEVVDISKASLKLKNAVEIIFSTEDIPVDVKGDSVRIQQIVENLIGNAIKFTEQGKISISITGKENDIILFSVTDTGIGIAKDQTSKIFDPFVQASSSISNNYGGTGLGLSTCRELVVMMGGKIWVERSGDEGTEFCFIIHLPKSAANLLTDGTQKSETTS